MGRRSRSELTESTCHSYPAGERRNESELLFIRHYEAPERIYRTVIDASGDWRCWTPGPVTELMRPTEQ